MIGLSIFFSTSPAVHQKEAGGWGVGIFKKLNKLNVVFTTFTVFKGRGRGRGRGRPKPGFRERARRYGRKPKQNTGISPWLYAVRARTGCWTSESAKFSETFSALRDKQNSRKRGKKSKRRKRRSKTQGTSHAFRTQRTARPYPLADAPKRGPCGSPYPPTHQKACRPPPSEAIRRIREGHRKPTRSPYEGGRRYMFFLVGPRGFGWTSGHLLLKCSVAAHWLKCWF